MRSWLVRALRWMAARLAPLPPAPPTAEPLSQAPGEQTRLARELVAQFDQAREIALEMVRAERANLPSTPEEREYEAQRARFADSKKKPRQGAERF